MTHEPIPRLTDDDRAALALIAAGERRARTTGWTTLVIAVVVIPALMVTTVLNVDAAWWLIALLTVNIVIMIAGSLTLIIPAGGTVKDVLAGAQPTVVVTGTMSDAGGDEPYPWAMTFAHTVDGHRYAHFGDTDPAWLRHAGARVRLSTFGTAPGHRTLGVAMIESIPDGHRHWVTDRAAAHRRYSSSPS